jgi:hypothetical protein
VRLCTRCRPVNTIITRNIHWVDTAKNQLTGTKNTDFDFYLFCKGGLPPLGAMFLIGPT